MMMKVHRTVSTKKVEMWLHPEYVYTGDKTVWNVSAIKKW